MDAEPRDLTDEELGRVIIRNRRIRLRSGVNPSWHVKAAVISHDAPDGSAFTVLTYPSVVHAIGHAAFKQLAMHACWSADLRLRAPVRVCRARVCVSVCVRIDREQNIQRIIKAEGVLNPRDAQAANSP
jgi:hypothetical protein